MGWRIVSGPQVGEYVTAQTQGGFDVDRSVAIGLERDGKIVAGTVYENWNGVSVVCHIAWERVTPAYMAAVYDYPFNVANVDKIIGPISSNHTRALALVSKMGFSEEARIKGAAHDSGDIVLMTMTPNECRYLEPRYGQKITGTAAST
jgi:RimJ/RimL family protein N-acetyltransferase